jgi:hypothetical protein
MSPIIRATIAEELDIGWGFAGSGWLNGLEAA